MGWTKGKGLGANEEGQLNFIKVAHKNDQRGIGFQDRDDHWMQHENDFNNLLESFHNSDLVSKGEQDDHDDRLICRGFGFDPSANSIETSDKKQSVTCKPSGESLEELSRKSKARVHYKKATRGKDLSKYSEKDLASIFGKKIITEDQNSRDSNNLQPDAIEDAESSYGITTLSTGTSINDYFHNKKLSLMNSRNVNENMKNEETTSIEEIKEDQFLTKRDLPIKNKNKQKRKLESDLDPEKERKHKKTAEKDRDITVGGTRNVAKIERLGANDSESKCEYDGFIVPDISVENIATNIDSKKKKKKQKERASRMDSNMLASEKDTNSFQSSNVTIDEHSAECLDINRRQDFYSNFISNILSTLLNVNNTFTDESSITLSRSMALGQKELFDRVSSSNDDQIISFGKTTFEFNRYQAELFRFVDLEGFKNANLSDITGYGFDQNIDLKITANTRDNRKISDLWDHALINKYGKDVLQRRKQQKYHIKTLKKKSLFKTL